MPTRAAPLRGAKGGSNLAITAPGSPPPGSCCGPPRPRRRVQDNYSIAIRRRALKSAEAQSVLMLHRARHLLVLQRTAQVSAMRAHLAEFGIVAPKGRAHVRDLIQALDSDEGMLPSTARPKSCC